MTQSNTRSQTPVPGALLSEARQIILDARTRAVRSVDAERVRMYWRLGRLIREEEQGGSTRAEYGAYVIRELAAQIVPEFGSGFSVRQLELARQFYSTYPIANAVRSQLNWSQYRLLIRMSDPDKREYYEREAIAHGWTGRELERQVNSGLFERLLASTNRDAVMAAARGERIPQDPTEIIKDPMVLEFLGLERRPEYYERDLEGALQPPAALPYLHLMPRRCAWSSRMQHGRKRATPGLCRTGMIQACCDFRLRSDQATRSR